MLQVGVRAPALQKRQKEGRNEQFREPQIRIRDTVRRTRDGSMGANSDEYPMLFCINFSHIRGKKLIFFPQEKGMIIIVRGFLFYFYPNLQLNLQLALKK